MDNNSINIEIIKSIDNEINYYRKRQEWVFTYSMISIILLVTGQQTISVNNDAIMKIIYILFLVIVLIVASILRYSYRTRIYHLRDSRQELLEHLEIKKVYPLPNQRFSPSLLFLSLIYAIATIAIFIIILQN